MQRSMALSTIFFNSFMLSGADQTLHPVKEAIKPSGSVLVDLHELQYPILRLLYTDLFRAEGLSRSAAMPCGGSSILHHVVLRFAHLG